MKCIICNEINSANSQKCKCGWDFSSDYTVNPTISPLSNDQMSVFRKKVEDARKSLDNRLNRSTIQSDKPNNIQKTVIPNSENSYILGAFDVSLRLIIIVFVLFWSYLQFNRTALIYLSSSSNIYLLLFGFLAIVSLILYVYFSNSVVKMDIMRSMKFYFCCSPMMFYLASTSVYSIINFYNYEYFLMIQYIELYIIYITTMIMFLNSFLLSTLPIESYFSTKSRNIIPNAISFFVVCMFSVLIGVTVGSFVHPVKNIYLSSIHRNVLMDTIADFGEYDGIIREALGADSSTSISQQDLYYVQQLELSGLSTFDTSILKLFPNLSRLDIRDVTNLNITSSLPSQLTSLTLRNVSLSDSELSNIILKDLSYLDLTGNSISDTSFLSDVVSLRELNLSNNNISNIQPLSRLDKLKRLNLSNNSIIDISILESFGQLEYLNLHQNEISSVASLSRLKNLKILYIGENPGINFTYFSELEIPNVYWKGE